VATRNESIRMAPALRDHLAERGGGNFSAATRSYIYIGMAAAGDDLGPFDKDIQLLLCEPLARTVRERLEQALDHRPTTVLRPSYSPPPATPPELDASDSYAVGFEF